MALDVFRVPTFIPQTAAKDQQCRYGLVAASFARVLVEDAPSSPTHGEDLASNIELCNISCEGLAEHALLEDTFTAVDRSSTG